MPCKSILSVYALWLGEKNEPSGKQSCIAEIQKKRHTSPLMLFGLAPIRSHPPTFAQGKKVRAIHRVCNREEQLNRPEPQPAAHSWLTPETQGSLRAQIRVRFVETAVLTSIS